MPDYEKMYLTLFNRVTDMIEQLQEAQRETEEMYIVTSDREEQNPTEQAPK